MALSDKARRALEIALASSQASPESVAKEIADAVDSGSNPQAAAVAALGSTSDISAAALSTGDTYSDAAVNSELDSLMGEVEARLDAVEGKVDAVIAALKAAGLMAS